MKGKGNGVATVIIALIERVLGSVDANDLGDVVAALGRVKSLLRQFRDFDGGRVSAKEALAEAEKLVGALKRNDADADAALGEKFKP